MEDAINELIKVLKDWAPLIYAICTAMIGFFFRFRDIAIKKKKELDRENEAKNRSAYNLWEHEESQRVIRKIKDLCNYYKDKGHMDSVSFIQLENGTVATSKICNMFVSCLAEDNRFGNVHKYISKFQRVPYSKVSYWADKIAAMQPGHSSVILTQDSSALGQNASIRELADGEEVKSSVLSPIYDPNGVLIGAGVFLYAQKDFNGMPSSGQEKLMNEFKVSLESVFLDYFISRRDKRKELNIIGGDY